MPAAFAQCDSALMIPASPFQRADSAAPSGPGRAWIGGDYWDEGPFYGARQAQQIALRLSGAWAAQWPTRCAGIWLSCDFAAWVRPLCANPTGRKVPRALRAQNEGVNRLQARREAASPAPRNSLIADLVRRHRQNKRRRVQWAMCDIAHMQQHPRRVSCETTLTFRVDETLKDAFTTAAKARDRSGAQLLRDFMRDFVRTQEEADAHEAWFRSAVQAGLDAADAGDTVAAEDGEAEARAWRAKTRRKQAHSGS